MQRCGTIRRRTTGATRASLPRWWGRREPWSITRRRAR